MQSGSEVRARNLTRDGDRNLFHENVAVIQESVEHVRAPEWMREEYPAARSFGCALGIT